MAKNILEKLQGMDLDELIQEAESMDLAHEGLEEGELRAALIAKGYNPEAVVEGLLPAYIGIIDCAEVQAARSQLRADAYNDDILPEVNVFTGRVTPSKRPLRWVPIRLATFKKMLADDVFRPSQHNHDQLDDMREKPESWDVKMVSRLSPKKQWLVTLYGEKRGFDRQAAYEKFRPTAI